MKPKKVLLVTPPYHAGVVESAGRWMPLSLVYLAGAAREAGFEPEIYDAMTKQHTLEEIAKNLEKKEFDYIGITAVTSSFPASIDVLKIAKKQNPNVKTILGGVHPTFCYDDIFRDYSGIVDFIIYGEGEKSLPALMAAVENDIPLGEVRGIVFQDEKGKVVKTAHQAFAMDIDALPTAWDLVDWEDYVYFVIPNSRLAAINTSRGCTHGCTFCSQQKFWNNLWRGRKPENIVEEIKMLYTTYGANVFLITDEYPTLEQDRWEHFLNLLIAENLPIYLLMETRVEDIVRDEAFLWKYKKAGIIHIYIGIEATDQATLDIINKEMDVDSSKKAIDLIHSHGMITETSFVLGFPWETQESIDTTLKLAKHYDPDFAHFLTITPWPYADMYEEVKDHIEVWDYSKYNLVEPIIRPESMTLDEIRSAILNCYKSYYISKVPSYVTMKDNFKRGYLKKSMSLIMKNSFLSQLIEDMKRSKDFTALHKAIIKS